MQKKRVGDTHLGTSKTHDAIQAIHDAIQATHDAIQAIHAPTTPESTVDTTGDTPNVQPLPPGAPGSMEILVKMIGGVLHVLNVSFVIQNLA